MRIILLCIFLHNSYSLLSQWNQHIVTSSAEGPLEVVVGDIDNDGNIDVLNVNDFPVENFVWYKNIDGSGNFSLGQEIGTIALPMNMAVGDIDGDGDLDVLGSTPHSTAPNLVSFKNLDGLGTFGSRNVIDTPNTSGERAILVRDMDGDGNNDLVVGSIDDDTLAWYKNLDGDGTFDSGNIIISNYVNGSGIDVGDIDGDGDPDIVAGTLNFNIMSWFENLDGAGNFGPPQEIGSSGAAVLSVFLADIDGDDDLDVVGSAVGAGVFAWWENLDGQGNFSLEHTIDSSVVTTYIYPVDLDNDDDMDVLTLAPGFLRWYENLDGLGNFGNANIIKDDLEFAITVTAADLDNDGDMDPISASQTDNTVYWFENDLLGIPDLNFQNIEIYPNPTKGLVYISSKPGAIINITVFDILGKEVFKINEGFGQMDISSFQSGMYLIKITTDSGSFVEKIIKE